MARNRPNAGSNGGGSANSTGGSTGSRTGTGGIQKDVRLQEPVVALDIGGSSVKSGVVYRTGIPFVKTTVLDTNGPEEAVLQTIGNIITETLAEIPEPGTGTSLQRQRSKPQRSIRVAMGFPGPFDYEAGVCYIKGLSKYTNLYGVNIADGVSAYLPFPAEFRFRNDAEAAILGEAVRGAGAGYRRILGITLGTGMGSAFIEDRLPVTVPNPYMADGSLFPLPARVTTRPTPEQGPDRDADRSPDRSPEHRVELQLETGSRGDDVFSTRGLLARIHACTKQRFEDPVRAAAAAEKDPTVRECFRSFGWDLGEFLSRSGSGFRPDVILVLGGLTGAADLFVPECATRVSAPVVNGVLGAAGPLLGAAALFLPLTEDM
jgi:glucokinase